MVTGPAVNLLNWRIAGSAVLAGVGRAANRPGDKGPGVLPMFPQRDSHCCRKQRPRWYRRRMRA